MSLNPNVQEFVPATCGYKISTDQRYFENRFKSWSQIKAEKAEMIKRCDGNTHTVISALSANIDEEFIDYILSFIRYLLKEYNPDTVGNYEYSGSVYTGISGFCILFFRVIQIMDEYDDNNNDNDTDMKGADININNHSHCKSQYEISKWNTFLNTLCTICNVKKKNELRDYLLKIILKYNNNALNDFESRQKQRYSFLEGISGCYGIRIIYYYYMKNSKKMNKYIAKLKDLKNEVLKLDAMELLYGRMGYISTYLFVNHFIAKGNMNYNLLECDQVQTICDSVIEEGRKYVLIANNISKNNFLCTNNIPLMWEWHNSQYFGAAHGVCGILNTLISIPYVFEKHKDILMTMLECCQTFKFKSGNFASSVRGYYKGRDSLVQFCHGSTGFVSMFVAAAIVANNNEFVKYGIEAQEIVWKRGLLRKGVGLCHGIGGNGYVFLTCYRMSEEKELRYLYRAMKFAQVMVSKHTHFARKPDRPDSLFEGKCGGVIFVLDVMFASQSARFPCYEWY